MNYINIYICFFITRLTYNLLTTNNTWYLQCRIKRYTVIGLDINQSTEITDTRRYHFRRNKPIKIYNFFFLSNFKVKFFLSTQEGCNTKECRIDSIVRSLHPRALTWNAQKQIYYKTEKNISISITIINDSQYILLYAKLINTHCWTAHRFQFCTCLKTPNVG